MCVYVGALYVCVCVWLIKLAYTSILFIEQLFLIDLCHFFPLEFIIHNCAYIGRSLTTAGAKLVFDLVLLVSKTFTSLLDSFTSLAPSLEYLCNCELQLVSGKRIEKC